MTLDALNARPTYERHDDDGWIDEVRIVTVPRWKTSGLSGDEWRFSAHIEAYRKGVLLARGGGGNIRDAAIRLPSMLWFYGGTAIGDGWEFEPERPAEFWDAFCSNPACREQATIEYRRLHHYCREGHIHDAEWRIQHVRFCEAHKRRGDCAFEDADRNLVVVALRKPDGTWQPITTEAKP